MQASDWYYWTKSKYAHYIVFRDPDTRIGIRGKVTPYDGNFKYEVLGPDWLLFEKQGTTPTLEEAQKIVDEYVKALIKQEFAEEYVHPLG